MFIKGIGYLFAIWHFSRFLHLYSCLSHLCPFFAPTLTTFLWIAENPAAIHSPFLDACFLFWLSPAAFAFRVLSWWFWHRVRDGIRAGTGLQWHWQLMPQSQAADCYDQPDTQRVAASPGHRPMTGWAMCALCVSPARIFNRKPRRPIGIAEKSAIRWNRSHPHF